MAEHRSMPLHHVARPGRFGADVGNPGVMISIVHPVSLVAVISRKGKAKVVDGLLKRLDRVTVMWAGPAQYFVQSDALTAVSLKQRLGDHASVIDQSQGRVVIRIAGPQARTVLAKGTPVDLHHVQFPLGKSAMTQMGHVGVHIHRSGTDEFTLSVFRGFSESFWEWLTTSAAEFGYQVL
jgi:methylglutamate dehydrogenase subunit D